MTRGHQGAAVSITEANVQVIGVSQACCAARISVRNERIKGTRQEPDRVSANSATRLSSHPVSYQLKGGLW